MSITTTFQGLKADAPKLFAGGLLGLLAWEIFANPVTSFFLGGPLQPQGLIIALFQNLVGLNPGWSAASALHYATGIAFYPLGYWLLTRSTRSFGLLIDGVLFGVVTWFLALGVFASLAGLPFMLGWIKLTWFSLIGHVVYGVVAALVFEGWRGRVLRAAAA